MNGENTGTRRPSGDDSDVEIPVIVADALAATVAAVPPDDLLARVTSISTRRRAEGEVIRLGAHAVEPLETFLATATDLRALLRSLDADEWNTTTATEYGTVRGVVAHLAGIEDYCTRALAREPAADPVIDFDHPACSRAVADSLTSLTDADLVETWFAMAINFADAFEHDTDPALVSLHQLPVTIDGALALRTFEVWAHTEDICRAVGRPLTRLDGPRLSCMSSRLVEAIGPFCITADDPSASARVVLLGPGGGVADIGAPIEPGTQPQMRFVADVVDYCRVAARRLPIDELSCTVEGNTSLVTPFLRATAMFAKD